jgi:hypothetical protein
MSGEVLSRIERWSWIQFLPHQLWSAKVNIGRCTLKLILVNAMEGNADFCGIPSWV